MVDVLAEDDETLSPDYQKSIVVLEDSATPDLLLSGLVGSGQWH
jgi:hypothetical protein